MFTSEVRPAGGRCPQAPYATRRDLKEQYDHLAAVAWGGEAAAAAAGYVPANVETVVQVTPPPGRHPSLPLAPGLGRP